MPTRSRLIMLLGVPILLIAAIAGLWVYTLPVSAVQAVNHIEIPLAAAWVPFTADVVMNTPGEGVLGGKFYRSSDGSDARVNESPKVGDLITIHNTRTKSTYVRFGDQRGWAKMPIPQSFLRPPDRVLRVREDRARKLPEPVEGLEVWEILSFGKGKGVLTNRKAPALNGFTIFTDQFGALIMEYKNIRIGEPPAEVFLPPAGAVIDEQAGPEPRLPSR